MDPELQKVIAELEWHFDAELARQEDEAAHDLAIGLRQDRLFRSEAGQRGSAVLVTAGSRRQVSVVGRDYVGCGWPLAWIVKIERAVIALGSAGSAPAMRDDTFIEVARRWQRAGLEVELALDDGAATGTLDRVAADHLLLRTVGGELLVPLPAVAGIRLVRGG